MKRRECWLPAFSSFPTMFSKSFFSRIVKSLELVFKVKLSIDNILDWMIFLT